MKLTVEKTGSQVKVEFTKDTSTKSVSIVLDDAQVKALIGLLQACSKAKVFKFSVDL